MFGFYAASSAVALLFSRAESIELMERVEWPIPKGFIIPRRLCYSVFFERVMPELYSGRAASIPVGFESDNVWPYPSRREFDLFW